MDQGFFLARNKQKLGPFSLDELQGMAAGGQLGPADMILPPGSAKWQPAASFNALFPAAPAQRREAMTDPADNGHAQADPSEALSLSASHRHALGRWQLFHPTGSRMHKLSIGIAAAFTLIFCAAAVAAVVPLLTGPPGNGWWIGVGLFVLLALLPAIGLFVLVRRLRWRLFLFEKGFVLIQGGERVVLWTDVTSVLRGGNKLEPKIWFVLDDGPRITLDSAFQGFSSFSDTAEDRVNRLAAEKGAAALARGEAVSFGKTTLSPEGIEDNGKELLWPDIDGLAIEWRRSGNVVYTALVVYQKTSRGRVEWCAKRLDAFPNFKAFAQLASRYTTIETKNL